MIRFYLGSDAMADAMGYHHWRELLDFLEQQDRSAPTSYIKRLTALGEQMGFRLVDGHKSDIITLYFDDPHRELFFKLKYL